MQSSLIAFPYVEDATDDVDAWGSPILLNTLVLNLKQHSAIEGQ